MTRTRRRTRRNVTEEWGDKRMAYRKVTPLKDEPGTSLEDIQVERYNFVQAIDTLSGKIDTLAKPPPSPWFLPTGWPNLTASRLHRMALLRWGRTLSGDRWALAKENGTIKQQKNKSDYERTTKQQPNTSSRQCPQRFMCFFPFRMNISPFLMLPLFLPCRS